MPSVEEERLVVEGHPIAESAGAQAHQAQQAGGEQVGALGSLGNLRPFIRRIEPVFLPCPVEQGNRPVMEEVKGNRAGEVLFPDALDQQRGVVGGQEDAAGAVSPMGPRSCPCREDRSLRPPRAAA